MVAEKAKTFAKEAKSAGWKILIEEFPENDHETRVTATKGEETICLSWYGEAMRHVAQYWNGEYHRSLRNARACYRKLHLPPTPAPPSWRPSPVEPKPRVQPKVKEPEVVVDVDELEYVVPVTIGQDLSRLPAKYIIKAVRGKVIDWQKDPVSKKYSAKVMDHLTPSQLKVGFSPLNGKRILTWEVQPGTFCSIYIERIVGIK